MLMSELKDKLHQLSAFYQGKQIRSYEHAMRAQNARERNAYMESNRYWQGASAATNDIIKLIEKEGEK